jgi:crotonobetainyl-CoA:carnitine CoA-transferase CaiB-like acyl-CoA transferase
MPRLSGTPGSVRAPDDALGEHVGEVPRELLAPDAAQIAAPRAGRIF